MADIVNIVNTILANGSTEYQTRVPEATRDNIAAVANPILEYASIQNEFLSAIVNKIAFTVVLNRTYSNPLSILKKGAKPLGLDIESIHTNPAEATTYDPTGATLLAQTTPDVASEYFRLNRQDQYPTTINLETLRHAFTSWENLNTLVDSIITSLYSGDYIDEFILMKNTFAQGVTAGKLLTAESPLVTDAASAASLVTSIKTASSAFTYPSTAFNAYKKSNPTGKARTTWCPREDQVLIIRSDLMNFIDVNVLAAAFNMDKATFLTRKLEVDNFGSESDIQAIIMDQNLLQVWDDMSKMTEFYNPKSMTQNYYWNHWQTYSLSTMANGLAFIDPVEDGA